MKYFVFCLLAALLSTRDGYAQSDTTNLPEAFRFATTTGDQLPPELLHTKSVVFVDVIDAAGRRRGDWKALAREVHGTFKDLGIDAVAYYYWPDANAGPDATRQLAKQLNQRYIENIIYLSHDQSAKEYTLLIARFDTENPYVNREKKAFLMVAGTPATLARQLDNTVRRSGLEKQNFLVIDVPEFFVGSGNVIRGNRAEGFAQDLKLDKLAIPRFGDARDSAVVRIFEPYPYEHALVDANRSEDELRQDGFQYILQRLRTREGNIKQMLGYSTESGATNQEPVYKYYVKHIYTGDVYLGNAWDADASWESALINHLRNMRDDMTMGR
ncbi:MAG: hypothetical protein WA958_13935 [Tunicatimonas sp.]